MVGTVKKALVGVVLALAALPSYAVANGEIHDPCAIGAAWTLPDVEPDGAATPWLDLCDTDVAGTAGAGDLRAVRVTFHLGGDIRLKQGAAAYSVILGTKRCNFQIAYSDSGMDSTGATSRVQGTCDVPPGEPCPILSHYILCEQNSHEDATNFTIERTGMTIAMTADLTASTITLTFDPNKAPIPAALAEGLRSGEVFDTGQALSFVRAGTTDTGEDSAYMVVDSAFADKDIPLG